MKLIFSISFLSLLFSQTETLNLAEFNQRSIRFFEAQFLNDSLSSPYDEERLSQISAVIFEQETSSQHILAHHFLFRYYYQIEKMEMAYKHGFESLERAEEQFETDANNDLMFIAGYYQIKAEEFSTWMNIRHFITGVGANREEGLQRQLFDLNENSPLYRLSLIEKFRVYTGELFDINQAISTMNELMSKDNSKHRLMEKLADLYYANGQFEDALSILQTLSLSQDIRNKNLVSKIANCYFFLGEFDVGKQYIKQFMSQTLIDRSEDIIELIYRLESKGTAVETQMHRDSLVRTGIVNYELKISFDEFIETIEHVDIDYEPLDFFLNRKNLSSAEYFVKQFADSTQELYVNKQFSYAKLFWLKKDFFNSKRYLHNLLNSYAELFNPKMLNQANFILADIAFQSNDFDESERYLQQTNTNFLYFYHIPKFNYLNQQILRN